MHRHLERYLIRFVLLLFGLGLAEHLVTTGPLGFFVVVVVTFALFHRRFPRVVPAIRGTAPRPPRGAVRGLTDDVGGRIRRWGVERAMARKPDGLFPLWEGVPIGVDALTGEQVSLKLVGKSLLVGGIPGGGKTVLARMIVAAAARDPECELYLIDGKKVGLGLWRHRAKGFAAEADEVVAMLEQVQATMMARYEQLMVRREEEVTRGDGFKLLVVVIDELSFFTDRGAPHRERTDVLLGSLVKLGRAAGVIVVAATQKPTVDVITSQVRDNMGWRLAFRTRTRQSTEAILGDVDLDQAPAHRLPHDPGSGYLLAETGHPRLIHTYDFSQDDARRLAGDGPI